MDAKSPEFFYTVNGRNEKGSIANIFAHIQLGVQTAIAIFAALRHDGFAALHKRQQIS